MASWARPRVAAPFNALSALVRNRDLARLELSWAASVAATWVFQVAAFVVAYRIAGPLGVGAVGVGRMLPAAMVAPLVVLVERHVAGRGLLLLIHIARAAIVALVALGLAAGVAPAALLVLVALEAAAGVLVRPVLFALVPAIATAPEELVAANVGLSFGEGIGTLAGPVIGGLLVASAGPGAACVAYMATVAVALGATLLVHVDRDAVVPPVAAPPMRAVRSGLIALQRHAGARVVVLSFFAQVVVRGLLSVLIVVASIELLGLGDSGVGLLNAAIGLGGLLGALAALGMSGVRRVSLMFAAALVGWGLPIAVIGVVPVPFVAGALLVVLGASNAVLDISGFTLLQRLVPNAERTAVFGLLEAVAAIGMAVGSVAAPLMLELIATRPALVATGAILPVTALLAWRRLAHVEDDAVVPKAELDLLRSIPMFAPLPMTVVERLAGEMARVEFAPGDLLIRQGDVADCFYAIGAGTVEVTQGGRLLRTCGSGTAVGEIGLLRRVRRTATVRALTPTVAYAVRGEVFVAAVLGNRASSTAADGVIDARLAFTPAFDAVRAAELSGETATETGDAAVDA